MRNKYRNIPITVHGIKFDSMDEYKYYEYLLKQKATGAIKNFEIKPKFELQPKFRRDGKTVLPITYEADYTIYHNDGTVEIIDVKGMETQQGILRRKLFLYRFPELKLTWITRNLKHGNADGWIKYEELKRIRAMARKSK